VLIFISSFPITKQPQPYRCKKLRLKISLNPTLGGIWPLDTAVTRLAARGSGVCGDGAEADVSTTRFHSMMFVPRKETVGGTVDLTPLSASSQSNLTPAPLLPVLSFNCSLYAPSPLPASSQSNLTLSQISCSQWISRTPLPLA
jgi:hypothetical protein